MATNKKTGKRREILAKPDPVAEAAAKRDHNTTPEETERQVRAKGNLKKGIALQQLKIEYRGIDELKPNQYNPNRQSPHEFEMLLKSMRDDGFTQPVLVRPDGTIVDGEHRWRAARSLGLKKIPVVVTEIDDVKARVATLTHNRARGSEDIQLVAEMFRDFEKLGALPSVQEALGMSDLEVERLIADIPAPEALAGEGFSQSWEPAEGGLTETKKEDGQVRYNDSATAAGGEALREQHDKVRKAKSQEERDMAKRETGIHRIGIAFTDAEWAEVEPILSLAANPSEAVLGLCRAEAKRRAG